MFILLMLVTFVIAFVVSMIVVRLFKGPMQMILDRIISDEISSAWLRYLIFAIFVVGISGGVRVWDLEKYITPSPRNAEDAQIIALNLDRWILEVYRTVIGTLQSVAWMLLVFFVFALIAYVIVRIRDSYKTKLP
ncbi:hypothetical protein K8I28_08320 [bacterium]|nr:hypothetical protein [bacterium]